MHDAHYSEKSYQEKGCIILKSTQKTRNGIIEKDNLQPFK